VHEYIVAAFNLDEAIAFFCVKPLNYTLHLKLPPSEYHATIHVPCTI
jgi:hypothetical protein